MLKKDIYETPKGQVDSWKLRSRVQEWDGLKIWWARGKSRIVCYHWHQRKKNVSKRRVVRVSLMVQWLRIRLPVQGTRVRALIREDPTCHRATKPARLEPMLRNKKSHRQWEAHASQRRAAPARHNLRNPARSNEDPTQPKVNKFIKEKEE